MTKRELCSMVWLFIILTPFAIMASDTFYCSEHSAVTKDDIAGTWDFSSILCRGEAAFKSDGSWSLKGKREGGSCKGSWSVRDGVLTADCISVGTLPLQGDVGVKVTWRCRFKPEYHGGKLVKITGVMEVLDQGIEAECRLEMMRK